MQRSGGVGRKRDAEGPPDAFGAGWSRGPGAATRNQRVND